MTLQLVRTNTVPAANNGSGKVFEDFDLLKTVVASVPNEVFHEAVPLLEQSQGSPDDLGENSENHSWKLVNVNYAIVFV